MGQGSFYLSNIKLIHRKFAKIKTYNAIRLVQTSKCFDKSEFNTVLGHSKGQLPISLDEVTSKEVYYANLCAVPHCLTRLKNSQRTKQHKCKLSIHVQY